MEIKKQSTLESLAGHNRIALKPHENKTSLFYRICVKKIYLSIKQMILLNLVRFEIFRI